MPFPFRKLLHATLVLACADAGAEPIPWAANWWNASDGTMAFQYFVDVESVRREDRFVYYRLFGKGPTEHARQTTYEAEVRADCQKRTRSDLLSITRWTGGSRTTNGMEMLSVFPGTRQQLELDTACRVASTPVPTGASGFAVPVNNPSARGAVRWTGTGFAVARDIVVTNLHVVQGCSRLEIAHDRTLHVAEIVARDPVHDLAALRIARPVLTPLQLAARPRELGESVVVLGYPLANILGSELRVSTGIVGGLSGVAGAQAHMHISAPVQPGNSGGPVLDDNGRVAGVVVSKLDQRMNVEVVNFAVRLRPLRTFLDTGHVTYATTARSESPTALPTLVRQAAPSVLLVTCS